MTNEEVLCNTAVASWKLTVGRFSKTFASLTDEQLQKQVAPGRNRLFYLLGHMAAVHDRMLPMLGIGDRLYPQFDEVYVSNPDRKLPDVMSGDELKAAWTAVNDKLTAGFEAFTPSQWLQKHSAMTDEDHTKDPLRNRLAVVLSRTGHIAFHMGQVVLAL